jgi:DHA2 family multidrug resistance protein
MVLDTTIANVAIPAISPATLGVSSSSQGTWVITSFAVANAICRADHRLAGPAALAKSGFVHAVGAAGFVVASLAVRRGAQPGDADPVPGAARRGGRADDSAVAKPAAAQLVSPTTRSGMALAMWSMTVVVAPIFGPILGGWISDNWHWSWIFFINVPVGLLALFLSWKELRHRETGLVPRPIDRIGLALLVIGVGACN